MMKVMTWQEAQSRLLSWANPLRTDDVPLRYALYSYTDRPLASREPYPPSALAFKDGFAVNYQYVKGKLAQEQKPLQLRVMGKVPTCKARGGSPLTDRAFRAQVGDFLPDWLDTIVDGSVPHQQDTITLQSVPEENVGVIPAGAFIPRQEGIIGSPRRLGYPELAILSVLQDEEVHAYAKPITGMLIGGSVFHRGNAAKSGRERMPDILTPMFHYIFARWQFPFVSLGIHGGNLLQLVEASFEKVDILLLSALMNQDQWEALVTSVDKHFALRINGLQHPLGQQFLTAENKGRWFFFLPYQPVFALAMYALLLHPFLFRMCGDPEGKVPFREGRLLEGARVEVPEDDIWIGEEQQTRDFTKQPELKLLRQVSKADMSTLARGNCLAIPRSTSPVLNPGDPVTILRY